MINFGENVVSMDRFYPMVELFNKKSNKDIRFHLEIKGNYYL